MAIFRGSTSNDEILLDFLSARVRTDPAGLSGTADAVGNIIFGYGGSDVIETGAGGEIGNEVYGGLGDDNISSVNSFGHDRFYGGAGNDVIYGNAGANLIDGGSGADYMFGSVGYQHYVVDDPGDVVEDVGSDRDGITSTFSFRLTEDSPIEDLFLADGVYAPELGSAKWAIGNKADNTIAGNRFDNVLEGRGGSDWLLGAGGDDLLIGGQGNDQPLQGGDGDDTIRGQDGMDILWGGTGADTLIGGRGDDIFAYEFASEFDPRRPDTIGSGDGAAAFKGAGAASGDAILLPKWLRAGEETPVPLDFDEYAFGGTGKGHISVVDRGERSLVRVNADNDAAFEMTILIADGAVRASAYTADDFVFDY